MTTDLILFNYNCLQLIFNVDRNNCCPYLELIKILSDFQVYYFSTDLKKYISKYQLELI